jgi:membrane protease YdiL (CAAX protease family)
MMKETVKETPMSVKPVKFFVLTFALSWAIWIPLTLSHFGIGSFHIAEETSNIVRLSGVLMPAVSALILTVQSGGRSALRALLSRLILWRVDLKWWFAAVAVQPFLLGLAAFTFNMVSSGLKVAPEPVTSASVFIVNVIILLVATLGEEIGWRGVSLPGLQGQYTPLKSSVILGLLWATWHLPFWLLLDSFDQFGIGYLLLNFLFVLPLTFYITWFFNHGRQSILLAVALHLTFNIVNTVLLPVTINVGAFLIFGAMEWVIALAILPQLKLKQTSRSFSIA